MVDPYAGGLPQINQSDPSARYLQEQLKRVGYMDESIPYADNYGPRTQDAVMDFHNNNPEYRDSTRDPQIGPMGWAALQAESSNSFVTEPVHNYTRVTYTGKTINVRTRTMIERADALLTAYDWSPYLTQGSYNPGGVGASAGTHDGGGVIDIRTTTMTTNGANLCVQALRKAGFAAWYRTPAEGFSYHIHAVAIGDWEMSPSAADQVVDYFAGRNGLANNGPDSAPSWVGRPYPVWCVKYS